MRWPGLALSFRGRTHADVSWWIDTQRVGFMARAERELERMRYGAAASFVTGTGTIDAASDTRRRHKAIDRLEFT